MKVSAIVSMLHESPRVGSATRAFRGRPVLEWTLNRIAQSKKIGEVIVTCWDDQAAAVAKVKRGENVAVQSQGSRKPMAMLDSISAARKWSDGWRGGLLGSCEFDLGFHPQWAHQIATERNADAVLLIDPASALVDPRLIDAMIDHAADYAEIEFFFAQAAPGLTGLLLRPVVLERLARANVNPGRLLSYMPDQPTRDLIATDAAVPVATPVSRCLHRFKLDSDRQVEKLTRVFEPLNGQLISSSAEELVDRVNATATLDTLPRELVLELNTTRRSSPIFWPGRRPGISRGLMTLATAEPVLTAMAHADDMRLTLAGVGDPLEADSLFDIVSLAKQLGIAAVHLETDLLTPDASRIERLVSSGVDVVSVHLPAATPKTYEAIMGVDELGRAVENLRSLILAAKARPSGLPLVVPTFVKTQINLGEMEVWYDHWMRTIGHAVITGPSDFSGLIPDHGVADMHPRRANARPMISNRLVVLVDGQVVTCEEDVLAERSLGTVGKQSMDEILKSRLDKLRDDQKNGPWNEFAVCDVCGKWHRP